MIFRYLVGVVEDDLVDEVQAGLPLADNCLFSKIEPFSEVKFKIWNT